MYFTTPLRLVWFGVSVFVSASSEPKRSWGCGHRRQDRYPLRSEETSEGPFPDLDVPTRYSLTSGVEVTLSIPSYVE